MEHNLDEACVYIYAAMGLYEESVDLALKVPGGVGGCGHRDMCVHVDGGCDVGTTSG